MNIPALFAYIIAFPPKFLYFAQNSHSNKLFMNALRKQHPLAFWAAAFCVLVALLMFGQKNLHLMEDFTSWLGHLAITLVSATVLHYLLKNFSKYSVYIFGAAMGIIAGTLLPDNSFSLQMLRWIAAGGMIVHALHKRSLTTWIFTAMILGVMTGYDNAHVAVEMNVFSKIFIRLIKTIIAPLLFSTLVVGIAGHSNLSQVGRLGWKSLLYFEVVTTIALVIGLMFINWTQAGQGIEYKEPSVEEVKKKEMLAKPMTEKELIIDSFPENIIKSVSEGKVLQIVIFSILFGMGMALLSEEKKAPMLHFAESLSEVMFKFTGLIMYFVPIGVGAAIAYTVGHMGIEVLKNLAKLVGTLYMALFTFILLVLVPIALLAKINIIKFAKTIAEPVSIAFATTSSDSALPKAMEVLEKFGVPRKIIAFVLPMGYSFNLDGTTLYLSLATLFVAQAAKIDLSVSQQLTIMFTLMLTSKGVAAVPRASLIILFATASSFGLPDWPIFLILGVDEIMDMARTSVNIIGNCLATVVMAKWEGEFDEAKMNAIE